MPSLKIMINLLVMKSVPGGIQEQSCVFPTSPHEGRVLNPLTFNVATVDHSLLMLLVLVLEV